MRRNGVDVAVNCRWLNLIMAADGASATPPPANRLGNLMDSKFSRVSVPSHNFGHPGRQSWEDKILPVWRTPPVFVLCKPGTTWVRCAHGCPGRNFPPNGPCPIQPWSFWFEALAAALPVICHGLASQHAVEAVARTPLYIVGTTPGPVLSTENNLFARPFLKNHVRAPPKHGQK